MLTSAFTLKCHTMLLIRHLYKTVMNIGYYYHQGSTNRHMDQQSKYCGNQRQLNVIRRHQNRFLLLMSQSIPTRYIPPGNSRENLFERANPGDPGNFFCLIPCPGAKIDGRIPWGGAKFSRTRRNCSLSLQKSLKN